MLFRCFFHRSWHAVEEAATCGNRSRLLGSGFRRHRLHYLYVQDLLSEANSKMAKL